MRFVKIIVILLLSIVGAAGVIGLFLPDNAKVERSIYVKSRASIVYDLINDLNQWPTWSPWHQIDPNTLWNYSEPAIGKGRLPDVVGASRCCDISGRGEA